MNADALPKHRLRVLSGRHAGAEVLLKGRNSLSASPESDLQLHDWVGNELHIVRPDAETVWYSQSANAQVAQRPSIWHNWSPLRFGGVVLAHGPDSVWPSDEELWSRWLLNRGTRSTRPQRWWRLPRLAWCLSATVCGVLCVAMLLAARHQDKVEQAAPVDLAGAMARLPRDRIHLTLSQSSPPRLTGWVLDDSDRAEVQQLLNRHVATAVVQDFLVLSEVQRALSTALGSNVLIQRTDGERFLVTGQVSDLAKTRKLLANTLNDLKLQSSQVLDRLTAAPELPRPLDRASLKTDALRYQQQADGSLWIQLGPWQPIDKDTAQRGDTP